MKFIDEAEITVRSGDGGAGCVSFRREKYLPKGGPDGGDGGKGGDVLVKATKRFLSFYDLGSRRCFKAQNGRPGSGRDRSGKNGRDSLILVPLGTMIQDMETGELVADLVLDNHEVVLAEGGAGGKGNKHFATSTNRTPRFAQEGRRGIEKRLKLELKLIADIGIIGLPNAGKSTLLSCLSGAHPKIAAYPFTTLTPNLGVMLFDDDQSLTLADIPGLIEGAASGKGLGHKFLQHIERTAVLLHVLDIHRPTPGDILTDFSMLQKELVHYHPSLMNKDQVIALNKIDIAPVKGRDLEQLCDMFKNSGHECWPISALTGAGIGELKNALRKKILERL